MPRVSPRELLARLAELGIPAETHEHPAVFTVAESRPLKRAIPGAHSKNLFLKDRKGRTFLVVAKDDTEIDLKRLHDTIGASGRLSFGSAELLSDTLGVEPGSVTPFAVINDDAQAVRVILDERLARAERVNFHPLVNTMTTGLSPDGLLAFLRATGHEPQITTLPAPAGNCGTEGALPSS
jgi:Ala-tRNA(Pro) deacylase